ncbi:MAG: hypothetical protein ACFFCS_24015 [Candidatus Hodarchaeota archaeon]
MYNITFRNKLEFTKNFEGDIKVKLAGLSVDEVLGLLEADKKDRDNNDEEHTFLFGEIDRIHEKMRKEYEEKNNEYRIKRDEREEKMKKRMEESQKRHEKFEQRMARKEKVKEMVFKGELEGPPLRKIKQMFNISDKIRLYVMRETFSMNPDDFYCKLWGWAEKYNLKIDGDYVITKDADIDGFIKELSKKDDTLSEKQG